MRLLAIAVIITALVLFSSFVFLGSHLAFGFDNTGADRIDYNKSVTKNLGSVDLDSVLKQKSNNPKWISNPEFIFLSNRSGNIIYGLPSYWNYSNGNCEKNNFKCAANSTSGWKVKANSFQISTNTTSNNKKWSFIYGSEINVNPGDLYAFVTHMKLNEFVRGSHVVMEGYNQTSEKWYQIMQCPTGTDGPLEWRGFSCVLTIPAHTAKIRPILNAGWSAEKGKEAITLFGPIYLTDLEFAPSVNDPKLKIELVSKGLEAPVTMSFLGPNDYLIAENSGKVQRIVNGIESKDPLLEVAVSKTNGMLGIATAKHGNGPPYVFLYMESIGRKGGNGITAAEVMPRCNCLYRYELANNNKLVNPKLLLSLPAYLEKNIEHNGGIVKIGPDNNVYLSGGDFGGLETLTENFNNNNTVIGGGIYRISQNGEPVGNILGNIDPLNKFYAYGIRESFGIDFDPLTGHLWDTENGPNFGDEINLVEPGFNSGGTKVDGIWNTIGEDQGPIALHPERDLVDIAGKGKYRPPELTWRHPVGPTALTFLNSTKLGKQYENDMFIGDFHNGNIYHFKLNKNRTALLLNGSLADKMVDQPEELQANIIATGFGGITDIKVGPDGYLYVIAMDPGKIYRIVPDNLLS
jgi:glucose/arabinose dehydrogenase